MQVLIWNIQQFGLPKTQDVDIGGLIGSTIYPPGGPPAPEIVVMVEVGGGGAALGTVPVGSGAQGFDVMLQNLQLHDANWRAVPPVSLAAGGMSEAIGVLYRSNVVTFAGPHVWSNYGPVPAAPASWALPPWNTLPGGGPAIALANYPLPWNVAPFNVVGALAPQIQFPNAPPGPGSAFVNFAAPNFRRPQRTTFTYNGGANTLDLWVIHTSPQWIGGVFQPIPATLAVAGLPDIAVPPPASYIRVVCGDFNVDAVSLADYGAAYGGFVGLGYVPQIGYVAGAGGSSINPPTPTMFEKDHPLYNDYMGVLSVDNALTWSGGGAGLAVPAVAIVNRVSGAPAPYGSDLAQPLAFYPGLLPGAPQANAFQGWANFGHIGNRQKTGAAMGYRGASDHLPLLLTF